MLVEMSTTVGNIKVWTGLERDMTYPLSSLNILNIAKLITVRPLQYEARMVRNFHFAV
jgi:hypothetical protein